MSKPFDMVARTGLPLVAVLGAWVALAAGDAGGEATANAPDRGLEGRLDVGTARGLRTQPHAASMPGFDDRTIEHYLPAIAASSSSGEYVIAGPIHEAPVGYLTRNLLVFAGVHGFQGPTDLGQSGNFGFHEGINWGGPLWRRYGYGLQLGVQGVHSNLLGNQAITSGPLPSLEPADRNQLFFTAGIFRRRMEHGLQGGLAFDVFYDNYFGESTLYQIRSETALVFGGVHELGYWGAYGVSADAIDGLGQIDRVLEPTDLFAFFYRRRFSGGGQGRIWAGFSGGGDAILGLDGSVPLGTSWALDNNFTVLLPKSGRSEGTLPDESWSVSIHLVWYPGRPSRPVVSNPYHPLFYVADNSWFLVDRRR